MDDQARRADVRQVVAAGRAPLHGFADARDYYRRASSRYYLPDIRTPSLVHHSSDDPLVFSHHLPDPTALSPCAQLGLHTPRGHV
ncbi:hypothetical protein ACV34H_33400, partial [Pseudomonas aeruginosa]